jgi:Transposase, Mutator family
VQEPAPAQAGDIDERVNAFLDRPDRGRVAVSVARRHPGLRRGRLSLKVRDGGRIVSLAAIIAVSVNTEGRCRVHGMRNALAHGPKSQHTLVAAAIRQAFRPPDAETAHQTRRHVADQLRSCWPKLAALMDDSEHDVLGLHGLPWPAPDQSTF